MLFKELGDFTIIDTETTGFGQFSKLIEFAAVKFRNGEVVDKFETFVNPHINIPEKITQITGITDEMVKDAPTAREITEKIYSFIGNDILVAHNAPFDIDVLNRRLEKGLRNRFIDTLTIFRKTLELDSYKLDLIRDYFEIDIPQNHRALDDVLLTYECLKRITKPYHIKINDPVRIIGNYCPSSLKVTKKYSNILTDCHCIITGVIPDMGRIELQQLIINNGGAVGSTIIRCTRFLIIGENPGLRKIEKAEDKISNGDNIEIISYIEFLKLLNISDEYNTNVSAEPNSIKIVNIF
jgi:DNA polymerase III epsilon subunit family exonuclease